MNDYQIDVSFERLKKQQNLCIMTVSNFPKSESIASRIKKIFSTFPQLCR